MKILTNESLQIEESYQVDKAYFMLKWRKLQAIICAPKEDESLEVPWVTQFYMVICLWMNLRARKL